MNEEYDSDIACPVEFTERGGPNGPALVRAWADGKTDPGWGNDRFMPYYEQDKFRARQILKGFGLGQWNFAFVMRSVSIVCIDIDGKNGGLEHAGKLGLLPHTLAETSRSGEGYHLFYSTEEDEWDEAKGFALFKDRINLVQGVDFRATGCVYHWRQQRWNNKPIVPLPKHLADRLRVHEQKATAQVESTMKILNEGDAMDVVLMQDALVTDLGKPIPAGRRNATLFAIGQQMQQAGVPGWDVLLRDRAIAVGLDTAEAAKLLRNIVKYGGTT